MESIRVVLADDHWLMRDEMRRILERSPGFEVAGEAEDGQRALELVQRLQPDVIVLDIRMPKLNGIEVLQRMKEVSPNTRALVLTAFDDDDYILPVMAAGASGYMLKTARADELVDAARRIHEGESVLHPTIAARVARLWARNREQSVQETPEALSPRELEILQLAAKGLRNRAIADALTISNRTVEGHFNSIFNKISVSSRVEAVLYAISHHMVDSEENKT